MKKIFLTLAGLASVWCMSAQTPSISIPGGTTAILSNNMNSNVEVKGQVKISNPGGRSLMLEHENEDNWLTFHDPGDSFFSMGTDRSDGGKFKINFGGSVGANNHLTMDASGKLGLGTESPVDILDVNGRARFRRQGSSTAGFLLGGDALSLQGWGTHNPYIEWLTSNGTRQGYMGWNADRLSLMLENGFNFTIENGNVGIGTHLPDSKLTVKGDIHTREVRVDLSGAVGPDYVFERNYDLLSLSDLEAYINKNKHLPEVPSAKEMEEHGLNLKEMNLLLLKKVEELTLHIIELEKRMKQIERK